MGHRPGDLLLHYEFHSLSTSRQLIDFGSRFPPRHLEAGGSITPQGVKQLIVCKSIKIFKGFRMNRSRGRNPDFCLFVTLGISKWPDRAGEVDLPLGRSIWEGVEVPGGGWKFIKILINVRGVQWEGLDGYSQCSQATPGVHPGYPRGTPRVPPGYPRRHAGVSPGHHAGPVSSNRITTPV